MYQKLFKNFENVKNLGGKAWEHAIAVDFFNSSNIEDCSIHCFHYQQMLECFFKHILETKSPIGSYSRTHKLNKLLEELIFLTAFKTDKSKNISIILIYIVKLILKVEAEQQQNHLVSDIRILLFQKLGGFLK